MDNNIYLEGRLYVAGTRGYSAYEIAVKNGFIGTEEEWLQSLVDAAAQELRKQIEEDIAYGRLTVILQSNYNAETEALTLYNSITGTIEPV